MLTSPLTSNFVGYIYSVNLKKSPWVFLAFLRKRLGISSTKFYLPVTRSYLR